MKINAKSMLAKILLTIWVTLAVQPIYALTKPKRPKNIILMIGDGMGLTQVSAGMYVNGNKLNLEHFSHIGLSKTYSADNLITDSAAGATAFSIGKKTYNGAIGVDKDSVAHTTILETAEQKGLSTGLIVTCPITHATPAAFIAHQKSRAFDENIALDMLKTPVDIMIGGGQKFFDERTDQRNLIQEFKTKGYFVSSNLNEILNSNATQIIGFTAKEDPITMEKGRGNQLELSTTKALNMLSKNKKGFFLMVEGSQIDWGGHANEPNYITSEMIDFDNTIGTVLNFAKKNKNTLVIVTADHETGGFAINGGSLKENKIQGAFTTKKHTGTMVPVYAFGPGAAYFSGIYENTAIFDKMMYLFGF